MTAWINRSWKLVARPEGAFKPEDFKWTEEPVPDLAAGQALVRQIYLSMDPTSRGWANSTPTYLPPVPLNSVMRGFGLGVVEESRDPSLQRGDYVPALQSASSFFTSLRAEADLGQASALSPAQIASGHGKRLLK